jgi:hypothetical protein
MAKRVIAMVTVRRLTMAMGTRVAGNKESNGNGGKSDGDGYKGVR